MGEITDKIFDGIAKRQDRKNLESQGRILERQKELDENKRELVKKTAQADASVLEGSTTEEIRQRLDSHIDSLRVGDAAVGNSAARGDDDSFRQLEAEMGVYLRQWQTLKAQAIGAQGRLNGTLPRPNGYESGGGAPRTDRAERLGGSSKGPLGLAFLVFLVECLQTSSWLNGNLSNWQSSIGGNSRKLIVFGGSAVLTLIVVAITFIAGRRLKEAVVAGRVAAAEQVKPTGGLFGQAVGLGLIAAAFQMVVLGLRFSTETGDQKAQTGAIVVGLVGLFGAFAVALWEYSVHQPLASAGTAVYTRAVDAEKVDAFRRAEYRRYTGIPQDRRNIQIVGLRMKEASLEKLQKAALGLGPEQVSVLNTEIDGIRRSISDIYEKSFEYDPLDLDRASGPETVS
jgi:hypothetical protein